MKDLRTRRASGADVDLEGPSGWSRGSAWDDDPSLSRLTVDVETASQAPRLR